MLKKLLFFSKNDGEKLNLNLNEKFELILKNQETLLNKFDKIDEKFLKIQEVLYMEIKKIDDSVKEAKISQEKILTKLGKELNDFDTNINEKIVVLNDNIKKIQKLQEEKINNCFNLLKEQKEENDLIVKKQEVLLSKIDKSDEKSLKVKEVLYMEIKKIDGVMKEVKKSQTNILNDFSDIINTYKKDNDNVYQIINQLLLSDILGKYKNELEKIIKK